METEDLFERFTHAGSDLLNEFFHILWKKSNGGRDTSHTIQGLIIPDTIVVHHSRVMHWYFTSKDGTILVKQRKSISVDAIKEQFLGKKKGRSISGCTAQFLQSSLDSSGQATVTEKFLEKETFDAALRGGTAAGMFQRFVDPKRPPGGGNAVVVANWTPNVLLLERRENMRRLDHDRYGLEERCGLLEASSSVQTAPLVSSHLVGAFDTACSEIAQHISVVYNVNVHGFTVHFKVTNDDRLCVLYCSALKISEKGSTNPRSLSVSVGGITQTGPASPSPARRTVSLPPVSSASPSKDGTTPTKKRSSYSLDSNAGPQRIPGTVNRDACALCQRELKEEGERLNTIPTKHALFPLAVLSFYTRHPPSTIYFERWGPGDEVPNHVLLLFPMLSNIDYQWCKDDELWLGRHLTFCPSCLDGLRLLTQSIEIGPDGSIQNPFGKSGAAPDLNHMTALFGLPASQTPGMIGSSPSPQQDNTSAFFEPPSQTLNNSREVLQRELGMSGKSDQSPTQSVRRKKRSSLPPLSDSPSPYAKTRRNSSVRGN